MYIYFIRDVRQPLSQIRLSLSASLGAGQIIFLAGINATENMVSCILWKKLLFNTSDFSQPGSCSFFLFCRLLVSQQQLLCSIFWWLLSVGCWLKEFISTCLSSRFTTSTLRCTCTTSYHGVFITIYCHIWYIIPRHTLHSSFSLFVGLPVVMVAISLSIAAGKEGMKSFTNDK